MIHCGIHFTNLTNIHVGFTSHTFKPTNQVRAVGGLIIILRVESNAALPLHYTKTTHKCPTARADSGLKDARHPDSHPPTKRTPLRHAWPRNGQAAEAVSPTAVKTTRRAMTRWWQIWLLPEMTRKRGCVPLETFWDPKFPSWSSCYLQITLQANQTSWSLYIKRRTACKPRDPPRGCFIPPGGGRLQLA